MKIAGWTLHGETAPTKLLAGILPLALATWPHAREDGRPRALSHVGHLGAVPGAAE